MPHFWFIFIIFLSVFQILLRDEAVLKTHSFPVPALTIPFPILLPVPALTIPFPVNKLPNKLAPKVPNNILKNSPSVSYLIVLVTPLFNFQELE